MMPVRVLVPGPLRAFANGRSAVSLDGSPATVGDALAALRRLHPGLTERVLTETGDVRPHVNLFVSETNIRDAAGLSTRIPDGAEIAILPAVSGG